MVRNDREYWARLRVDKRSNWAGGLALIAVLSASVSIVGMAVGGPPGLARANPIYWLVFLPTAWWGSGLMGFEADKVRLMPPLTYAAPLVAFLCLIIAALQGTDWSAPLVASIIAFVAAVGSRVAYRGSLLQREGPAR